MSNPYAEHNQAETIERIAGALERIADCVERYADADPMTVLHEAMQGAEDETALDAILANVPPEDIGRILAELDAPSVPSPEDVVAARDRAAQRAGTRPSAQTPLEPYASNGVTIVYRHPDPRFELVLRREPNAESGYVATIEEV